MKPSTRKPAALIASLCLGLGAAALAYSQQPLLQVTSPVGNSLAAEGATITITVSVDPSVQNVSVLTQSPLPDVVAERVESGQ